MTNHHMLSIMWHTCLSYCNHHQACGARPYMEDRVTIIAALRPLSSTPPAATASATSSSHAPRPYESSGPWVSYGSETAGAGPGSNGSALESAGSGGVALPPDGVLRSYAAVFDGHNGAGAAEIAAARLHQMLASDPVMRGPAGGWKDGVANTCCAAARRCMARWLLLHVPSRCSCILQ